MSNGDSTGWELFGAAERQPDFDPEPEPETAVPSADDSLLGWVEREDQADAARFEAAHREHGQVELAHHTAGYYVVGCHGCREHVIVNVKLTAPPVATFTSWPPPAAEEGPKFGIDDVIAGLRAVDARLRRVEAELRHASAE